MPFIMFESNKDYQSFERMLNNPENDLDYSDGWITGLGGKIKGNHNLVYIISKNVLNKFDKINIKYKTLLEEKAKEHMSIGGREYFEKLKKNHPEFIV